MKVIFVHDVKGQGKKGQIKEVSEGYANNYLLPNGLARMATAGNMNILKSQTIAEEKRKYEQKKVAQQLGEKLNNMTLIIHAKAGEGGRLFGAITTKHISQNLGGQGIVLDKRKIELPHPIRTLGTTEVMIKIHPEVKVILRVQVTEE